MKRDDLLAMVALGEDSRRQFKADVTNADSLAADLVAFSNSSGGVMLIGIADDGAVRGLNSADVRRINQLVSNAATQHMRGPISPTTENVSVAGKRIVIVLTVPEGLDKPYFDRHGVMWVKTGSDRRRIQSKEELRRLFQMTSQFHADELPTKAGIDALDKLRFRDYLREAYKQEYPDSPADLTRLLQNLNPATDTGGP
jgi:ATP-dependent DNA helicase RecG